MTPPPPSVRNTLLIYLCLWCAGIVIAAGGIAWLGVDARIPVDILPDGTATKSRSVAVLWFMPAILTFMYGLMALGAGLDALRRRHRPVTLGEDAQRSLVRYGRAIRNTMVGFGALALLLQVFTLLRAGGVIAPLGLDREGVVRVFAIVAGVLFAYAGNATPKIPYVPTAMLDPVRHFRSNRFAGWVFLLGGFGYVLSALLLPFDRMTQATGLLVLAMIALPAVRYAAALAAYRRQKRWEDYEGLV